MYGPNEVESLMVILRDKNLTDHTDISTGFYVCILPPSFIGMAEVYPGDREQLGQDILPNSSSQQCFCTSEHREEVKGWLMRGKNKRRFCFVEILSVTWFYTLSFYILRDNKYVNGFSRLLKRKLRCWFSLPVQPKLLSPPQCTTFSPSAEKSL